MQRNLDVSDSVVVDASPAQVWALVSDPSQTSRWSPENTGASSTGTLAVGDEFDGTNTRRGFRWVTRSVVTASEPQRRFAFRVHSIGIGSPRVRSRNASWEYVLEPVGDGTRVTETWHDDRRWPDAVARVFDRVAVRSTFAEFQAGNIRRSLDRLKAELEQHRP